MIGTLEVLKVGRQVLLKELVLFLFGIEALASKLYEYLEGFTAFVRKGSE
jgi:hypothetical protein